jgi:hypothetical protein
VTLFALQTAAGPNDPFLAFLDSNTLVFGHRVAFEMSGSQIIDRQIVCEAIDALRPLVRRGFSTRYGQVTLAGASLSETFFGSPHFQRYIFLLFLFPCALGEVACL